MNEEQLKFATPASLLGAFIFGANGSSVVKATCVNGKWRRTRTSSSSSSSVSAASATSTADAPQLSKEHVAQLAAAAKLADANSDDVLALACGIMNIPSTSGEEEAVGQALAKWFTTRGWRVELQKVAPQSDAAVKADRYVPAARSSSRTPCSLALSYALP